MTISVNNNQSALIALQNLNQTQGDLQTVQNAISTGLRINNPKDNAAIWAIAQGQRADIGALDAVKMSLDRANSIAQVSMTAGQSISDTLIQMKAKVTAALDPSFDPNSRKALNADYVTLLNQVQQMVNNATFDGANILNGSMTGNIKFLANADANSFLTLSVKNMSLGGASSPCRPPRPSARSPWPPPRWRRSRPPWPMSARRSATWAPRPSRSNRTTPSSAS